MDRTHGAHADGANGVGDWMPDPRWVHVEPDPSGIGARQIDMRAIPT
jgi:hypothetical protein